MTPLAREKQKAVCTIALRISNGRFGEDKCIGDFTYVATNGNSVIDYVLMSPWLYYLYSMSDSSSRMICLILVFLTNINLLFFSIKSSAANVAE